MIASANMAKNRALKVTGASGLSQPEVLQKWEDSHEKILKLHLQLVTAKEKHTEYVEKLGLSYEMPDGSTFKFSGTDTEQAAARKAMREDAKDQKNLQEVKQVAITVSVSVRQQEQGLRHKVSRQMQRAHAMCQLYGLESYTWIAVT